MPSNCSLEDICTGACDIVLGPNNAEDVAVSVSVLSSVENAGTVKDVVKVVRGSTLQLRAGTRCLVRLNLGNQDGCPDADTPCRGVLGT
jgi:hypothetical protein